MKEIYFPFIPISGMEIVIQEWDIKPTPADKKTLATATITRVFTQIDNEWNPVFRKPTPIENTYVTFTSDGKAYTRRCILSGIDLSPRGFYRSSPASGYDEPPDSPQDSAEPPEADRQ